MHAHNLIAGHWEPGEDTRPVLDPGLGTAVGTVAWSGRAEAVRAADRAAEAFGDWARTTPRKRADILRDAADILTERKAGIARTLAREAGKLLPEAEAEVNFSAEYLRWFAEEARRVTGSVPAPEAPGRRHLTLRRPAGVALSLTPWNFPVSIQARKLAPMLAAGCTVVARVSEKAPLAATELFRVLVDAGVPDGVLNLVHGPAREITAELLDHPAVRVLSFTGSTEVGSALMARGASRIVRPLLELGGNAPFIVFDDADLDAAVEGAFVAKLRNSGQSCVAANRFLVQDGVAEEFGARLAARFDSLTLGHGIPETGRDIPGLGPVIDTDRVRAVRELVEDALDRGGKLLTSARELPETGSYAAPTLVADLPANAPLLTTEVFGPAAGIVRFRTDEEALALANATEMGLAAYLWTANPARAWTFGEELEAGIIGVNDAVPSVAFAPMGGVKQSGLGREGAAVGVEEFLDTHYLAWRP
ncbi:NAD-dependent succinate-semialdehyde dehydrogenase [Streptomyces sp. NPDC047009]|uniref:NAD-dependent succinate-semialdehyde dehydrogenase n=1 Tax=Streptomyces sp. NPDC047009 TaxID=3154496 RepID=UPI0033EE5A16